MVGKLLLLLILEEKKTAKTNKQDTSNDRLVMKKLVFVLLPILLVMSCLKDKGEFRNEAPNKKMAEIFENYYEERLQLYPLEATLQGDNRFNDQLPNDITHEHKEKLKAFYQKYLNALEDIETKGLNPDDLVAYETFRYTIISNLEELKYPTELIPFNQFQGLPLTMGQLGSGEGAQPFKTMKDYENWLRRVKYFTVWADSAIANFRNGMSQGYVLPRVLVQKMIPQMQAMVVEDPTTSLFYGPVNKMPATFTESEQIRVTGMYKKAIAEQIVPTYKKLGDFLANEYIHRTRVTSGIFDLPDGEVYYQTLVKNWTTTTKTPDEIFEIGKAEVTRIRAEMEKVKTQVGFDGNLSAFFTYLKTNGRFMPFRSPEQVLAAFDSIRVRMEPNLKKMFKNKPKTGFEVRRTEAFREASASAEYSQGSADGSRPGIFYVPIPDATKFNTTSGMESLFLHEAIPGHHYQVSLQQENDKLPKFMRFNWYGAYGEGWALYTESLGKELGLYTDPYQYMGALGDEIHRAIRLVVDVGLHSKRWTREQAIKYMLENEAASDEYATMEVERYMAIPGQALSYKIGALKMKEIREKYEKQLGTKFDLADFHDEVLSNGCMPLDVLDTKMQRWAESKK